MHAPYLRQEVCGVPACMVHKARHVAHLPRINREEVVPLLQKRTVAQQELEASSVLVCCATPQNVRAALASRCSAG